mmetsp:Transcript_13622/g.22472  ORF Transcript_13622/g.22472 Transcript_13622/m.22472 type:complete len:235 (+) Transcript_13622:205-909(+)
MNPVKNITISDAKTGFVILERKFRWPTHANSSNLGSLTQSFYQFAREVDDGFIESVVFEGKERDSHGGGKSSKHHQTMQMVCTRNEYETVSIYYDTSNYYVDVDDSNNLLLEIEEAFARECGELLSQVSARIFSLVDSVEENAEEVADIRRRFEFFAFHIDRIITTAFPPPEPLPPPPSRGSRDRKDDSSRGSSRGDRRRSNKSSSSKSHHSHNGRHSNSSSRNGGSKHDLKST